MEVLQRAYITLEVIAAPLDQVAERFARSTLHGVKWKQTAFVFPEQPNSASETDTPMILWSPVNSPNLTAFMPQMKSSDYFVIAYATSSFHFSAATIRTSVDTEEWPINEFIVYENGVRRRIVRAMRDSPRWEFFADGEPLPYEDVTRYARRRIRDRFVREDVLNALESWGAPVRHPAFWQTAVPAFTFSRLDA